MRKMTNTNWHRFKNAKCFSSKYISEYVGVDATTVNSWFGARSIPNNYNMQKLCDLFEIDQATARKIFEADIKGEVYELPTNVVASDSSNNTDVTVHTPTNSMAVSKVTEWHTLFDNCGLTRTELAIYLGVHITTISNWWSGRYLPKKKYLPKLCELFNLPMDDCYALAVNAHNVFMGTTDSINHITSNTDVPDNTSANRQLKDILGRFVDYEVDPSAIYMFLTEYKQCNSDNAAVLLAIYGKIEAVDYQKIYRIVCLGL